ncbi:MAG: NYN domain-containing protein [Candidatus Hatepunaea meridiana]|nr:NYN domain-containing protein [Candidatus Hatepunaea meridiana]
MSYDNVHIFWDNSNIWGGATDVAADKEPQVPWYAIRVYWEHIYDLVLKDRNALTKKMAGSVPPQAANLWPYAEKMGFDVKLLKRVLNGAGTMREQAVDEMLHLSIADTILERTGPETIILLSGDGNESNTGTSFPQHLRYALKRNWKVEVYSWSLPLNYRKFNQLRDEFPDLVEIIELDSYYFSLTFVQEIVSSVPGRKVEPISKVN